MISKKYRLKEREVKKVLQKSSKPFFSYSLVLNSIKNKKNYNRFSIIIGSKSVDNNTTRNFFRRLFYEKCRPYIEKDKNNEYFDFSVVIKKETKLDKKDKKSINTFVSNLDFVFSKFFKNNIKELKTDNKIKN